MKAKRWHYDSIQIRKDPLLILSSIVPVLIWALLYFGFPVLREEIFHYFNYDIQIHYFQVVVFFFPLIPMMMGMIYGFMLLDERDAGIISAISVTPFGKMGYFRMRMGMPFLFSFIIISLFCIALHLDRLLEFWQILLVAFITSFSAPVMVLFLGAFADNKVEGMAISKGFGLLLVALLIDYLVPAPYDWLCAYSPLFWVERAVFSTSVTGFLGYLFPGFMAHMLLFLWLLRKFLMKIE